MHFVPDADDPYGITRTLVDALPSGSCLVLSHFTHDFLSAVQDKTEEYRSSGISLRPRTRAEVARFFDGLDLVEPGLVTAPQWCKDTPAPESDGATDSFHVGVARVLR